MVEHLIVNQKGIDSNAATSPSENTQKCASCGKRIPATEQSSMVSKSSTKFPDYLRGGLLCYKCTSDWSQPIDIDSYGIVLAESTERVKDVVLSLSDIKKDSWLEDAQQNMTSLDSLVAGIASSFEATVRTQSTVNMYEIVAALALKASDIVDETAKLLSRASMRLGETVELPAKRPAGYEGMLSQVIYCLSENSIDLSILSPRLLMLSATEGYKSGGEGIAEADSALVSAVARFDRLLAFLSINEAVHELTTIENLKTLRLAMRSMLDAYGGFVQANAYIREAVEVVALKIGYTLGAFALGNVPVSDKRGDELPLVYAEMARLFALLDKREKRSLNFIKAVDIHTGIANEHLDAVETLMGGRQGVKTGPVPQNRLQLLLNVNDAKRHFQAAQELWFDDQIWNERASVHAPRGSISVAPDYTSLISRCDDIIDRLTEGNNLIVDP